jgi:AAA+ ATPase superfamily predicted ATPase
MPQNPFVFGNPVYERSQFVGRTNEINFIVNRIRSSVHESTSLVGDSRMGNTSLLKYLSDSDHSNDLGLPADQYCLVYIDFQGQSNITPFSFWKRVIKSIYRTTHNHKIKELAKNFLSFEDYDFFDLEDFFFEIEEIGVNVVIFADEFEYISQSPNIGGDFFGGLRSLAIQNNLCLVIGSRRELSDLCNYDEIKGSPFFNIFASIHLRLFSEIETSHLLDLYLEKVDFSFSSKEKEFIAFLGSGHPYFLQMAGYYWFNGRENGLEGQQLFDDIRDKYYQQSIPHLNYIWSTCDSHERDLLIEISLMKKDEFEVPLDVAQSVKDWFKSDAIKNLESRGLIKERNGKLSITLPCMRSFLSQMKQGDLNLKHQSNTRSEYTSERSKQPTYQVFVSHSSLDKNHADLVVEGLETRGISCWIAPRDISPGTPYPEAIINALNICKFLVVIFSQSANDSVQVMQEVERAGSKKLTIIPIRFENVIPSGSFELMLSSRHWLDAFNLKSDDFLEVLAKTIKG